MTKHSTTTPDQKQSFARWLEGQLTFRKWKASDLARQSNLSISAISLLLHAHRAPEPVSLQEAGQRAGFAGRPGLREGRIYVWLRNVIQSQAFPDRVCETHAGCRRAQTVSPLAGTHGDPGGWEVVGVMADPDCELQKVRAHAPRVSPGRATDPVG